MNEMKFYLNDFLERFEYPEDASRDLMGAFSDISEKCPELLSEILKTYESDCNCDYGEILKTAERISAITGIHEYTVKLLVFICLSKRLKELYAERSIPESIWYDSMCDLKYKLYECRDIHGINGSFVAPWFDGFFKLNRFALGRFQFEIGKFEHHYEKGGKVLFPDSEVLYVHIPRSKIRLEKDICDLSFKMAQDFFAPHFVSSPLAFACHSWLLYPENENLFPKDSNLLRFMREFDVIESGDYGNDHRDLWRLFDMKYNGNPDSLPGDSSLRRAYKSHLKNGGKTGWGFGVFFPRQ